MRRARAHLRRRVGAAQILLSEMFYMVSSEPEKTAHLLAFWLDLLEYASAHPANCFLEPHRLTLLPFVAVFIGSDALQLIITQYVRSVDAKDAAAGRSSRGECRGGIELAQIDRLLRVCLSRDAPRDRLRNQIMHMAALVTPIKAPALVVSSAQMDVHALTHIFSRFLAAFKLGAAHPDAASKAAAAVERLEKMALVRHELQRQQTELMAQHAAGGR
jgi:hypothetical protein